MEKLTTQILKIVTGIAGCDVKDCTGCKKNCEDLLIAVKAYTEEITRESLEIADEITQNTHVKQYELTKLIKAVQKMRQRAKETL